MPFHPSIRTPSNHSQSQQGAEHEVLSVFIDSCNWLGGGTALFTWLQQEKHQTWNSSVQRRIRSCVLCNDHVVMMIVNVWFSVDNCPLATRFSWKNISVLCEILFTTRQTLCEGKVRLSGGKTPDDGYRVCEAK